MPEVSDSRMNGGVIHDLGYRPYGGVRGSEVDVGRALFWAGFRHVFGFGRSAKSKWLPLLLLALNMVPALVMLVVLVVLRLDEPPTDYAAYAGTTQMLASVFVASQAPVLFSRDLRYGSIVLYLARPMRAATYALMRWAALFAAMMLFLLAPVALLLIGALLADLDVSEQLTAAGIAALLAVLLAGMLTSVGGVISSMSTRRGFAVVATIAVLLFGFGVVSVIQEVAQLRGRALIGEMVGLASPYSLYRGLAESLPGITANSPTPPDSGGMQALYVIVALTIALGGLTAIGWRYRRVAGR
jgi:ABC-2 type transport system permease protein